MIQYISKPFKWFFKLEAASGLVLLFAAIIALLVSNSAFSTIYNEVLKYKWSNILDSTKTFSIRTKIKSELGNYH